MAVNGTGLSRRKLVGASLAALSSSYPQLGKSSELYGFDPVALPAIAAKNPAGVLLEAIVAAGDRLVAVGAHGVIIYSDDLGDTWVQSDVPVDVTLTCVAFATAHHGWAAGHYGVILATTDGGKTWKLQLNGIQANQLTLQAAQSISGPAASNSPGAPLALRRANFFVRSGASKPFLTLIAFSPDKVIVIGAYKMAMLTVDGGQSWMDWSLHIYDRLSHNIYMAQPVGADLYLVGESGSVFRSSDGGNTFLPIQAAGDTTLFGIVVIEKVTVVFGVAGSVLRSVDGCKTWIPVDISTQDDITAGRVFGPGLLLLGTELGELFISRDLGITFQAVAGLSPMSIFDMISTSRQQLILVGATGVTRLPETALLVAERG